MDGAPLDVEVRARCEREMGMQHHTIERIVNKDYHYSILDQLLNFRLFADFGNVIGYLNVDPLANTMNPLVDNQETSGIPQVNRLSELNQNQANQHDDNMSQTSFDGSENLEALLRTMDTDDEEWAGGADRFGMHGLVESDAFGDLDLESDVEDQGALWEYMG
jgi:hypothetical protein